MSSFLEEVRERLSKIEYPLEFDPTQWEDKMRANCYTYALGLDEDEGFLIGDFIGKRVTDKNTMSKQLDIFKEELEALGFDIIKCDVDDFAEEGYQKIYIEWNEKNQYHFLRQNADGVWSHKAEGFLPTIYDKSGHIILNPENRFEHIYGMCFLISQF